MEFNKFVGERALRKVLSPGGMVESKSDPDLIVGCYVDGGDCICTHGTSPGKQRKGRGGVGTVFVDGAGRYLLSYLWTILSVASWRALSSVTCLEISSEHLLCSERDTVKNDI